MSTHADIASVYRSEVRRPTDMSRGYVPVPKLRVEDDPAYRICLDHLRRMRKPGLDEVEAIAAIHGKAR